MIDKLTGSRAFRRIAKNKLAYVGIIGCLIIVGVSLFAPIIATHSPATQSMANRFATPSETHWFGTDQLGRDVFSRLVYGTRTSAFVSLSSIAISLTMGTIIGVVAGYKGGLTEAVSVEVSNIFLAFPTIVMGILILVAIGSGLANVIVALSIAFLPRFIRLARASTISVKQQAFVEAAIANGVSDIAIMVRHIVPNVIGPCIVSAALWTATAIRAEAALSFLGLGVQPPNPTWGNMISDGMRYIIGNPGLSVYPALTIMLAVLSFNMVGDAIRDYLDPRIQAG